MSIKTDLRRAMRDTRRIALPDVQPAIQAVAREQLPALLGPSGLLGIYWPLPGEADLRDLGPALGDRLALPVVQRSGPAETAAGSPGRLLYRAWRRDQPLEPDGCGIPAPPPTARELGAADLALLLVPALAIDQGGYRLGYGGGWYDRLRADPAWMQVPALAVLPAACRFDQLPRDPWDLPLSGWLSEDGVHWCRAGDGPAPRGNISGS
ncbi:MAG: 5-formyltetrahydrofolate cyclo-ligase [Cyanobacteriota bacterium]